MTQKINIKRITIPVDEYCENEKVQLYIFNKNLITIKALNEGGYNSTEVNLLQLLVYLKKTNVITSYNKNNLLEIGKGIDTDAYVLYSTSKMHEVYYNK